MNPEYDDRPLDVLALPAWRLHRDGDLTRFATKHVGVACKMRWPVLVGYLSRSVPGDLSRYADPDIVKRQEGGWTAGLYRERWRNSAAFVHTELMTIDIDAHGEIERAAAALARFRKAIHSTFKSTPKAPRCRVVLQLAKPCTDLARYRAAHKVMRECLYRWGYVRPDKKARVEGDIDEGASDATRLNYAPMHHPERRPEFLATDGELLDLDRMHERPKPPPPPTPIRERNPDKYREGALRRAEEEIRSALVGGRHGEIFKQAAALARPELGLPDHVIAAALYPAARSVLPESRWGEAQKTIEDGIARGRNGQ
jgi:hypothetical protein